MGRSLCWLVVGLRRPASIVLAGMSCGSSIVVSSLAGCLHRGRCPGSFLPYLRFCRCQFVLRQFIFLFWQARERVVVVSNFTSALDLVEELARQKGWQCLRIDGTTPPDRRQPLVSSKNFLAVYLSGFSPNDAHTNL